MMRFGKRAVVVAAVAVAAFANVASAHAAAAPAVCRGGLEIPFSDPPLPGGWSCAVSVTPGIQTAATAAVGQADATLPLGAPRVYQVWSAATQVVAGMNYKLVIRTCRPWREWITADVYVPLTGAPQVKDLTVVAAP